MSIEATELEKIIKFLTDELGGDWFLTGGSLVKLAFDQSRGTEDVDFLRLAHPELSENKSKHLLYQWLIANGLGPEWVNTAVEAFVQDIPEWQKEVVLLREGNRGRLYRPTLTLFVYLKLRRGTEIDLADVQCAIPFCTEGFDKHKFLSWADEKTADRLKSCRTLFG